MPNEQGGYTAEEEAEAIARTLHEAAITNAGLNAFPEQNPTVEQQNQQVARAISEGYLSQAGGTPTSPEQQGLLDTMGTMVLGLGPPYAESPRPYSGPAPMEAQPDWNYDSGYPGNWHDYNSNNTTTGGGFFNMEELFHSQGRAPPQTFTAGSNLPSTNNWRLLPPEFRKPNYIMRNGQIIDLNNPNMAGPFGPDSMGVNNPSWSSGASVGYPSAWSVGPYGPNMIGWPGAFGFLQNATGGS